MCLECWRDVVLSSDQKQSPLLRAVMQLQRFNKILTLELPGAGPDDYVLIDLLKEKGK